MKSFVLLILVCALSASETTTQQRLVDVQGAMVMVGKLPDPSAFQQLKDFMEQAKPDEIGQVLMQISIGAVRPARDVVVPMLNHSNPLVLDRALRAMSTIGFSTVSQRETIESLLKHDQPMVAIQAAKCLSVGGDMRVVPALINILNSKPEIGSAALQSLKQLSGADFKFDKEAWNAWYITNRMQATERIKVPAEKLFSEDPKERISAIQALGNQRADRLEVIVLLEPMLKDVDLQVGLVAQQSLAMLAPDQYSMPTARDFAVLNKPISVPPAKSGVIGYLAAQGFFDTWLGLFITGFTVICVFSIILYVLRSPPVKNMTQRFKRVVVAGTAQFMRPMTARIKRGTGRIVKAFAKADVRNNRESVKK
jgi:hypothetical protein